MIMDSLGERMDLLDVRRRQLRRDIFFVTRVPETEDESLEELEI